MKPIQLALSVVGQATDSDGTHQSSIKQLAEILEILFIYLFIYIYLFIFNKFIYVINLFLAVLGVRCCTWAFSSCGERGLLFVVVRGLLIASGFSCCRAWALGMRASVVVAHGLSSCGSWALERRLSGCGAWA